MKPRSRGICVAFVLSGAKTYLVLVKAPYRHERVSILHSKVTVLGVYYLNYLIQNIMFCQKLLAVFRSEFQDALILVFLEEMNFPQLLWISGQMPTFFTCESQAHLLGFSCQKGILAANFNTHSFEKSVFDFLAFITACSKQFGDITVCCRTDAAFHSRLA